ncbi:uncharacterized protein LOC119079703 [Bradysia coprophila]|uniref:uncharacterized protein LOC119079703 n=1 Tax=Bradysia coprophila TaxID=38358 RepID=UPI00187DB9E2|nr:uncharacterized protein LOC119079703 [Bradysia coprophila]
MYEPYLNREKQYLKMNAELDSRFKEIDPMKSDKVDIIKPRLNVFGNGSKVNNQGTKSVVHASKQKRNDTKSSAAASSMIDMTSVNVNPNNSDTVTLFKNKGTFDDKPQKLKALSTEEKMSKRKPIDIPDKSITSCEVYQSQGQVEPMNNTKNNAVIASPTTNDTTTKKNLSSDGLIKFLKSKVAILKQELEQSQQENVKNIRAYEGSVESSKKFAAQIDQLTNENTSLKTQVEKLQNWNNTLEAVMKEKDVDLATLNKEIVVLKKQNKEVNRLHSVLDKRFLKCQEDLEHLKKNLVLSQDCERQQRAVNQQQKNFFEDQIKVMSKQRTGLISAYKKQLLLLDNLKRQNLCLEQSKLLQLAEKDFMKILDWNSDQ